MKLKVQKPFFAFLILLVLTFVMGFVVFLTSLSSFLYKIEARNKMKAESVTESLRVLEKEINETSELLEARTSEVVELMASALSIYIENGVYTGPRVFEDGMVIQTKGEELLYPDHFSADFDSETFRKNRSYCLIYDNDYENQYEIDRAFLEKEPLLYPLFSADNDPLDTDMFAYATVKKFGENLWYMDLTSQEEFESVTLDQVQMLNSLTDLESSYNGYLLLFDAVDPDLSLAYETEKCKAELGEIGRAADIGITSDMLKGNVVMMTIDNDSYLLHASRMRLFRTPVYTVVLFNTENEMSFILNSSAVILVLTLIFAVVLILWLYWVQTYARDHALTEDQKKAYHPSSIRGKTASAVLIGTLAIFIIALTYQSIGTLYKEVISNRESLDMMIDHYERRIQQTSQYREDEEEWSVYYAQRIAGLIANEPRLQTKQFLGQVCDALSAEYIMLFDTDGKEITGSNDYINLSLGTDICEDCDQLRRVLSGDDSVPIPPEYDEIAEKTTQIFGVRTNLSDGSYGALIYTIDPVDTWMNAEVKEFDSFINLITPKGNLSLIIDKESGAVIYTSENEFLAERAANLGLVIKTGKDGDVTSVDLDTFKIKGQTYYGPFKEAENVQYLFLTDSYNLQMNAMPFALSTAVCFLVITVIISLFMLLPYKAKIYNTAVTDLNTSHTTQMLDESSNNMWLKLQKMDEEKVSLRDRWKWLLPESKTHLFIQIISTLFLFAVIWMVMDPDSSGARSAIGFIIRGNWERGVNLLAIAGVALLIVLFTIYILFRSLLMTILGNLLDPKGETIMRLLFSLLQYVAIIALLYFIFTFLGFDTRALLASVSILSLAVSFGSQGLVSDILAGIFIIFEDDFHVGDIIEVNGFSGIVMEIGVRSTKLIGIGDNIKIISNRDVKNVLNMSRMNSWYSVELKVPADQPLAEIEEMLTRELPSIGKAIPEIISGPYYKGVMSIGNINSLYIIAECEQDRYRHVQRELNRALRMLFDTNGYQIN